MPVPDFQTFMRPLLEYATHGKERRIREAIDFLADSFGIDEVERKELLPSGTQSILSNRIHWAITYLRKAGLLISPRRGVFAVTQRGLQVLSEYPDRIDRKILRQFTEFQEFQSAKSSDDEKLISNTASEQTPEEIIALGYQRIRDELAAELLAILRECSPSFFEQLVVDLLVKMGYGGSREDAGKAIGKSGDEGIDGIINEDRLGLDVIYLQAKRWKKPIGRPDLQTFVGALQGKKARKGVFITTSDFCRSATDYASQITNTVVLIDGQQLANLMIEYGIGVSTVATYDVKKIDSDYFSEA